MEHVTCNLDPELFDKAVHGGLDDKPVLPENGDLSLYGKAKATVGGNGMVVLTFTVQLPDGTLARAQCTTTARLFLLMAQCVRGWVDGGHL